MTDWLSDQKTDRLCDIRTEYMSDQVTNWLRDQATDGLSYLVTNYSVIMWLTDSFTFENAIAWQIPQQFKIGNQVQLKKILVFYLKFVILTIH